MREQEIRNAPSKLWRRIEADPLQTLAVMGMTKNTGKTVTLNFLLEQAAAAQLAVGVTSIGRDGEDHDEVFLIPKPSILVWPGTLVATARATLDRFKGKLEFIDATGINTPMGEVVIVRAAERGEMEIAGASRGADQRKVIELLRLHGARLVLLDGALGRSQHASPAIAQGVILATGAALGGSMDDVIRKTRERLAILGIEQADERIRQRCREVFSHGGVGLWNAHEEVLLTAKIPTLTAATSLLEYLESELATIALSGAVGRNVWQALMLLARRHASLCLVVADGTKLFVDNADIRAFEKLGARLLAYDSIRIVGISLNPFSPFGSGFAANEFLAASRLAMPGYEVSDVVFEETGEIG